MIVLLSINEASAAARAEASALAKARAQIAALQADNLRMRDEVAESERTLNELRKAYKTVCMTYGSEFYAAWWEKAAQSGAVSGVESISETAPAVEYAAEDYDPCIDMGNPFEYGPGFDNGSFVFCPDCGAMVQSGYGAFVSQEAADQYAREHCPKCAAAAKVARAAKLAERERFLRDLETVVKKAQPAVQRLAFEDLGGPKESVLILYATTDVKIWTACSSLFCIAKSIMEALLY